jgi:hypothetical protein
VAGQIASHKLNPIYSPPNGDCCCVRYCLNIFFSIPSGYHMEDIINAYKILLKNLKEGDNLGDNSIYKRIMLK